MSWSGDIGAMGQLADRLADLANVPSRAARAVAFDLEGFLQEEFDAGQDPYGTAWEKLAEATLEKGREEPPLTDSRRLRDGVSVRPSAGAGVSVTIEAPYAPPHQTGWSGTQGEGPARPILPAGEELPEEWSEAIASRLEREVRR